jgi:hypothetical protein
LDHPNGQDCQTLQAGSSVKCVLNENHKKSLITVMTRICPLKGFPKFKNGQISRDADIFANIKLGGDGGQEESWLTSPNFYTIPSFNCPRFPCRFLISKLINYSILQLLLIPMPYSAVKSPSLLYRIIAFLVPENVEMRWMYRSYR